MTHTEEQLQHSRPVGLRMPIDMYQMCEAEAAGLGCSTATSARRSRCSPRSAWSPRTP
jgi:hypothetical protein